MSKVKVGVQKFFYAKQLTADAAPSTAATYDTPKAIAGLRSVGVDIEQSQNTLYADDSAFETESGAPEITISLELAQLPLEDQAALLGATYDSTNKILTSKSTDSAPYVCVMFAGTMSDGGYRGVKVFKVKFGIPSDEYATKEEDTEWQPQTIEGKAVVLQNDQRWRILQDFASTETTQLNAFFASVFPASNP